MMNPSRRMTILAIAWTILILVVCWLPRQALPTNEGSPSFLQAIHADKVVHCAMFLGFAALWVRARSGQSLSMIATAGVALALITELGQSTPLVGRDGDIWDGIADSVGVGLGLTLGRWWEKRVKPMEEPSTIP